MNIRKTELSDIPQITELYRRVASVSGGIARTANEITDSYVEAFVNSSISRGISLIATSPNESIIGEIHAFSPQICIFAHVLSDLTIAVSPDSQNSGVGGSLFEAFLNYVINSMPHIKRVELITRESNQQAIKLYTSNGFAVEGKLNSRIMNSNGNYEADIPMAWVRT